MNFYRSLAGKLFFISTFLTYKTYLLTKIFMLFELLFLKLVEIL